VISVLVADNNPDFLEARCGLLRAADYDVIACSTIEETRAVLAGRWIHVAVIDKRMRDDDDDDDISGITLCKEFATRAPIPKIVVTAHPHDFRHVVEALRTKLIVNYVAVQDGPDYLLDAVKLAWRELAINAELEVVYSGATFIGMSSVIENAPLGNVILLDRAPELRDLFGRLFRDCEEICIFQLYPGHRNTVLVQVHRSRDGVDLSPLIVKCGPRDVIAHERDNYFQYVRDYTANHCARLENFDETLHFAGIVYSVVGDSLSRVQRFSDYYLDASSDDIERVIDTLFRDCCVKWYEKVTRLDVRLDEMYRVQLGLDDEQAGDRIENCVSAVVANADRLGFALDRRGEEIFFQLSEKIGIELPTPHRFVERAPEHFPTGIAVGYTHGDLNGNNILVENDGRVWLIDFERTGEGPLLRDFAELESVLRWELIESRSLERIYQFEKLLTQSFLLDRPIPEASLMTLDDDLRKAFAVIARIRWHAEKVATEVNPRYYYVGLLFHALRMITFSNFTSPGQVRPSLVRRAHALLSAAMICYRLEHWDDWHGWPDDPER
jgi:CheY-like chemotaxis protein